MKTTGRLYSHQLLLPNTNQWIKALNSGILTLMWATKPNEHLHWTWRTRHCGLYFGSDFPLLATESYALSSAECSEVELLK